MEKKNSVIIVVVIVIVVLFGLWFLGKNKLSNPSTNTIPEQGHQTNNLPNPITPLPFKTKVAGQNTLPDGFVSGFPLEEGSAVILNESAQTAAGLQSSHTFVSKKTPDENYKIYSDYLKKNNWKILTSQDTAAFKSISAKSATGVSLDLSISQNSVSKNIEVNIVFLHPLKTK